MKTEQPTETIKTKREVFTEQEARDFFSTFYRGEHHLPDKIRPHGSGFSILHHNELATTDFYELTRLVVMAHDNCIRVAVMPHHFKCLKICIWKRVREGNLMESHPTLENNISRIREKLNPLLTSNQ